MGSPTYHMIQIRVSLEDADVAMGQLYDLGSLGLEEKEIGTWLELKAYFEDSRPLKDWLTQIKERIPLAEKIEGTTIGLSDMTPQLKPFDPYPLVEDLMIIPPPEGELGNPSSKNSIILQPGLAFGSGLHETTRLVARALWHLKPTPSSLLDVGTGSGILALMGKKIGISKVETTEIDEEAKRNARQNFLFNGYNDIPIFHSLTESKGPYQLIVANLLSSIIRHLKPELIRKLEPRGQLILSGITFEEADDIVSDFRDFRLLQRNDTDDWSCLTLALPD